MTAKGSRRACDQKAGLRDSSSLTVVNLIAPVQTALLHKLDDGLPHASSVVAAMHAQVDPADLQNQEPVSLQSSPEATRVSIDPLPTGDVSIIVRWFDAEMAREAKPSAARPDRRARFARQTMKGRPPRTAAGV